MLRRLFVRPTIRTGPEVTARTIHACASCRSSIQEILRKPSLAWNKDKSTVPIEVTNAAQQLRQSLGGVQVEDAIRSSLFALIDSYPTNVDLLNSHLVLIERSTNALDKSLPAQDLQNVFRRVINSKLSGDVSTRLYFKLLRSPQLTAEDRRMNTLLFYRSLRQRGAVEESNELISSFLRASSEVPEHYLLSLLQCIMEAHPDVKSLVQIVLSLRAKKSPKFLNQVFLNLNQMKLAELETSGNLLKDLVENVLFENSHEQMSQDAMVLLLDTLLATSEKAVGRRALEYAGQRFDRNKDLALLELFLLCSVKFGEKISFGDAIATAIMCEDKTKFGKETWDTLVQWCAYRSTDIEGLTAVIQEMTENNVRPNSKTLYAAVSAASVHAKSSEEDISKIKAYFLKELEIDCEADSYSLLIKRLIEASELKRARNIFVESVEKGANWEMDEKRHLPVLFDLIISQCRSPIIEPEVIFDTYQRVRHFSAKIPYEAQVELLKMFLERDSQHDVNMFLIEQFGDTPSLRCEQFSDIYHAFYDKIMSCTDYKLAWALYGTLNTTIVLPYESYYPIQKKFCDLGRPDAAHLIFRHLRNRAKREGMRPPAREMYLMLFREYGNWLYEEGVVELETYFRMDLNNDLDIEIMNSVLAAYSNMQDVPKISDLWMEVSSFPPGKGANNATVSLMIKNFTRLSLEAVDILWENFPSQFGIQPSIENVKDYVVANCYHGYYVRALEIARKAPQEFGVTVNEDLIETVYNWSLIPSRKTAVESWAREEYPELWNSLVQENKLKTILLPKNTENDSEESIRSQAVDMLEAGTKLQKATNVTTDPD